MRLLLDSHVIVWWLSDPSRLSAEAGAAVRDPANQVWASAASIWELGLKVAKGKLKLPLDFTEHLRADSISSLPVREEHALASLSLPPLHGDPFDRILIAQAQSEKMILVTSDEIIPSYGVPVLKA